MEPMLTNERAERKWKYLCQRVVEQRARAAIGRLKGGQRASPLNLARVLRIELPEDALLLPSEAQPPARRAGATKDRAPLLKCGDCFGSSEIGAGSSSSDQEGHCVDWFDTGAAWAELDNARDVDEARIAALNDRQALLAQQWATRVRRVEQRLH